MESQLHNLMVMDPTIILSDTQTVVCRLCGWSDTFELCNAACVSRTMPPFYICKTCTEKQEMEIDEHRVIEMKPNVAYNYGPYIKIEETNGVRIPVVYFQIITKDGDNYRLTIGRKPLDFNVSSS